MMNLLQKTSHIIAIHNQQVNTFFYLIFINICDRNILIIFLDISFVENDLYHLLNDDLEGQILLKTYQLHQTVDSSALKHKIIYNEIAKDFVHFK